MTTSAEETELELARSGDRMGPPDLQSRPLRFWRYVAGAGAVIVLAPAFLMLFFYWIPALIAVLPVFQLDRLPIRAKQYRHVAARQESGWAHPR